MTSTTAIDLQNIYHRYGERVAINNLSLKISKEEIFIFLGPNGGGKTTLFRLLSTLIRLQQGQAKILDFDLSGDIYEIRRRIGVVFQAPSLDKKLTVLENLRHQGHLYGLTGSELKRRITEMLLRFRLEDRANEYTETLSGGLRRRVELAKGMLHRPQLLLLDEPSTGLDPGARSDLWNYLLQIRQQYGVTVVMTTHLLEEADKADRIAILSEGKIVALDEPDVLRATVGGDSITIETSDPPKLSTAINERFNFSSLVIDGTVRMEQPDGHQCIVQLVEAFAAEIKTIKLGKPTLEDVFIDRCGKLFE